MPVLPSPVSASPFRGADRIGQMLHAHGARRAFGIPGGEVLALLDGLIKAGIDFTLTKHENSAGFMAEGYWHATGHIPVLLATLGPGVANAINVVANARQDRVPLIFLTGCVDEAERAHFTHQVFDHQTVLAPLVKGSFRLCAGAIETLMARALNLALEGQYGPVHIDVPVSLAQNLLAAEKPAVRTQAMPTMPAQGAAWFKTLANINAAQKILFIAGVDAVNANAGEALQSIMDIWQAPVLTTYKAKGLVVESHPLALGGAGLSPLADRQILPFVHQADVIVCVGYDPIEMRIGWQNAFLPRQFVVELCASAPQHGMHKADCVVVGDIVASLAALQAARLGAAVSAWPEAEVATLREALHNAFAVDDKAQFTPAHVFHTLRASVPRTAIITADSGAHRILLSQIWRTHAPRTFLQSTGLCTMGCSLPLAMGYAMAQSNKPVLAIMGDAGLEMVLGELATLRDLALPLIIVVLVDESLALIEQKQRAMELPQAGVRFHKTDFASLAKVFGGIGHDVRSKTELTLALKSALATQDTFSLLACHVNADDYQGRF